MIRRTATLGAAMAIGMAAACLFAPAQAGAATTLTGLFAFSPGSCSGGSVSGSYIRMILPSGGKSGPYLSNSDSSCSDETYTPIAPGTDGGLITGRYQAPPSPAFDSAGNARAQAVTAPANFYGTNFAVVTTAKDRQTGIAVPAPSVTVSGGRLHADLRAWAVTWNNQDFNQGAPKPNGSYPGNTAAATGTYNASTGAFTLDWTSQVVGGPFDKFTGQWHLTGRFRPSGSGGTSQGSGSSGSGSGSSGTGSSGTGSSGGGSTGGGAALGSSHGGVTTGGRTTSRGTTAATGSGAAPGAKPGATHSAGAPVTTTDQRGSDAVPAAATTTVTRQEWKVSWWVVVIAAIIGAVAVAGLLLAHRRASGGAA